ncbi:Aldo/keto reductase [Mycena venus]|uniref:Aldo/keto reductase n=1 Tax=Mycena venus TaxID=2733690 RepID=A0A8H6TX33_9AGAR|nr:Aldo/keto reductase [Mycena venus]
MHSERQPINDRACGARKWWGIKESSACSSLHYPSHSVTMVNTTHLGGSASSVVVGRISHGLMTMHQRAPPEVPDEVCFASIKAGVDRLPAGAKMFLNSGEFYSHTWGLQNLEMLGRFYAKYPGYADKTFLSVKGAVAEHLEPDSSMENLRKSGIDRKLSIEEIMGNLVILLKEGTFRTSDCRSVYPVTAAEIEKPHANSGVSVLGYSPVGRGLLTGKITSAADIAPGDYRHNWSRFKDGNLEHNVSVVSVLPELAAKKGVTPAQLAIAWVAALGPHVIPLPGSSNPERTLENCAAGDIELSAEEMATLNEFAESTEVKGTRMAGGARGSPLVGLIDVLNEY